MSNIRLFPADWPCNYTITAENNDSIFSGLGLGKITDCLTCTVTEERNGSFELKMTYPVTGIRYSQLALRMIIVAPPNPYDPPQAFRIYSISKEYGGKVTVKAQHISYDLSDVMMKIGELKDDALNPKKIWDFMASHLASTFSLNTANTNYQFSFTSDLTIDDAIENSEGNKTHEWRLKGPKSVKNVFLGNGEDGFTKLYQVGNNNGEEPEFRFNNFQISLNRSRGENRGVTIRYGKNMKGFSQEESLEKIYTHVYPFYYASTITDYEGGYGSGAQRTYNDWACDLTDWLNSSYKNNNNPLIETGLKQDDGTAFNFRRILPLDVSSLYKGEYGIDLEKIGKVARYNQSGMVLSEPHTYSSTLKIKIKAGESYTFEDYDCLSFPNNPSFYTDVQDSEFPSEHYTITPFNTNIGLEVESFEIRSTWGNHACIKVTMRNNSNSTITITPDHGDVIDNEQYWRFEIGTLKGDGEVDTAHSYYYDLKKPEDVSKIAAKIEKPAIRYIRENHMERFPVQLKVDLDYARKLDVENLYDVRLCDMVTVIYPAFNVTTLAKCTKTEYDCLMDRYSKLDFSNSWSGLAFNTAMNVDATKRSFANLNYISSALGYAQFSSSM